MVNEGWDFDQLMAMTAREFRYWFGEQEAHWKARAEASRRQSKAS